MIVFKRRFGITISESDNSINLISERVKQRGKLASDVNNSK